MTKKYAAIGLMSGTSLDGLDICYSNFWENENGKWSFEINSAETFPYPEKWEKQLKNAFEFSTQKLFKLHSDYGFFLGEEVKKFINKNNIQQLDVIASHGHTIFHDPKNKYTVQIGDGRAIKILNPFPVVYDFRSQDVLMGGNGAPLVPIGDELLFTQYGACLNLGGFANISLKKNNKRIAYDICPMNIVLNHFSEKLGKKFDENGNLARNGNIHIEALSLLNQLNYYEVLPPKSLGIEWVLAEIYPILDTLSAIDALATFTEHIIIQLVKSFSKLEIQDVFITGGGAFHQFIISELEKRSSTKIIIPDVQIIQFKEALIFAFMGILKILGKENVLSSATGSKYNHSSGLIV